jgi:hypothetical protein
MIKRVADFFSTPGRLAGGCVAGGFFFSFFFSAREKKGVGRQAGRQAVDKSAECL